MTQLVFRSPTEFAAALSFAFLGCVALGHADEQQIHSRAHAHNDYLHERPLLDALDNGFCSVEADIFLVDGELLVAHTRAELLPGRTLKKLYLDPLKERCNNNEGRVHRAEAPFTLLIDIKSSGKETYLQLNQLLSEYRDLLTTYRDGKSLQGAINVVVSGNRDFETIRSSEPRYAGIDGRLSDLKSEPNAALMPLVSDNWRLHFRWRGTGAMDDAEREKLTKFVQQAHRRGQRIRFWATPDTPLAWRALESASVDLINTDDLEGLNKFLSKP